MFRILPRVLWSRFATPDEENRIRLGLNCLLLISDNERVLVEAGLGADLSLKDRTIYGMRNDREHLVNRLRSVGVAPEEVTCVVLTHLHLDHCGWCTRKDEEGRHVPTFPNAAYVVQKDELEDAQSPTLLTRGSYPEEKIRPVTDAGLWEPVDGEREVRPGITVLPAMGHTRRHQTVLAETDDGLVWFPGDLVPTAVHLRLHYMMGYDLYPADLLEAKREMLERAARESWRVVLYHDASVPVCGVEAANEAYFRPVELPPAESRTAAQGA